MSVRDPSRRKALKYGAMAALGLGAGVALGDVTGADRLVHAASPSGSDPVFSGTGIQFPSLTSDPSQLVGNMWYRSDLTAMKYSDGTNAHELAALDIANTWTATQTFTAAQTFNGGIILDAAGSIASTSTYIEADGAGGDMLLNTPSGKIFVFKVDGISYFDVSSASVNPNSDSSLQLGTDSFRWDGVFSNTNGFQVFHASGDTNPSAQLGDGFLKFGAGGASALDTTISRAAAGIVSLSGIKTAGGGTAPTTVSLTSGTAYTPSTTQNYILTVAGGTVTAIAINGTTTGLTSGTFYLKAGDSITVTFSSAPTVLQMVA